MGNATGFVRVIITITIIVIIFIVIIVVMLLLALFIIWTFLIFPLAVTQDCTRPLDQETPHINCRLVPIVTGQSFCIKSHKVNTADDSRQTPTVPPGIRLSIVIRVCLYNLVIYSVNTLNIWMTFSTNRWQRDTKHKYTQYKHDLVQRVSNAGVV